MRAPAPRRRRGRRGDERSCWRTAAPFVWRRSTDRPNPTAPPRERGQAGWDYRLSVARPSTDLPVTGSARRLAGPAAPRSRRRTLEAAAGRRLGRPHPAPPARAAGARPARHRPRGARRRPGRAPRRAVGPRRAPRRPSSSGSPGCGTPAAAPASGSSRVPPSARCVLLQPGTEPPGARSTARAGVDTEAYAGRARGRRRRRRGAPDRQRRGRHPPARRRPWTRCAASTASRCCSTRRHPSGGTRTAMPRPPRARCVVADAASFGGPPLGLLAVRTGTRWGLPGPRREAEHGPRARRARGCRWCSPRPRRGGRPRRPRRRGARAPARSSTGCGAAAAAVPDVEVVGDPDDRLPHVVTFSVLYADGEVLLEELARRGLARRVRLGLHVERAAARATCSPRWGC